MRIKTKQYKTLKKLRNIFRISLVINKLPLSSIIINKSIYLYIKKLFKRKKFETLPL